MTLSLDGKQLFYFKPGENKIFIGEQSRQKLARKQVNNIGDMYTELTITLFYLNLAESSTLLLVKQNIWSIKS